MEWTRSDLYKLLYKYVSTEYPNPLDFIMLYLLNRNQAKQFIRNRLECEDTLFDEILLGMVKSVKIERWQVELYMKQFGERLCNFLKI